MPYLLLFYRLWLFQTVYSIRSKRLSLKYQKLTPSSLKDLGMKKWSCGKDSIPVHKGSMSLPQIQFL